MGEVKEITMQRTELLRLYSVMEKKYSNKTIALIFKTKTRYIANSFYSFVTLDISCESQSKRYILCTIYLIFIRP